MSTIPQGGTTAATIETDVKWLQGCQKFPLCVFLASTHQPRSGQQESRSECHDLEANYIIPPINLLSLWALFLSPIVCVQLKLINRWPCHFSVTCPRAVSADRKAVSKVISTNSLIFVKTFSIHHLTTVAQDPGINLSINLSPRQIVAIACLGIYGCQQCSCSASNFGVSSGS